MKRKYFLALTLFTILSLTHTFQLYAKSTPEYTLDEVMEILNNRIIVLNGFSNVLGPAISKMENEESKWNANEEDIWENRIDYASADLWGLG